MESASHWKTPQQIATPQHKHSTTCHPIILLQKYVLVASSVGKLLLFGKFPTAPWKATPPLVSLLLENDATIVTMTVASNKNTLFVLSVEGHVYEISLHETDTEASLKLDGSWNTGMCGATCLAVASNQLMIGYNSGYLEGWKVRKRNCSELELQWRGLLD